MVKHLREMADVDIVEKQKAVLDVQPQFAYLERGSNTASAADLIAQAMCERWLGQTDGNEQLIDPQPIPASFSAKASVVHTDAEVESEADAHSKVASTVVAHTEEVQDLKPIGLEVGSAHTRLRSERKRSSVGPKDLVTDPVSSVGGRARQRRKRRKERPAVSIAEHLGQDGRLKSTS